MNNNYKGEELINKLYPDLARSKEVLSKGCDPKFRLKNLRRYLKRIEKIHTLANSSKRESDKERLKELYYNKYVIKEENIKERYYKNMQNAAMKRGYGAVFLDEEDKHRLAQIIISDQKKSLDIWIDYLFSNEINYPLWARYWAFHGMLSLGYYSNSKKRFTKRDKSTIKIFPVLDEDALFHSIKLMSEFLYEEKEYDDEVLNSLLKGKSFSKIYEYYYTKNLETKKNDLEKIKGEWICYKTREDAPKLAKSLLGGGTEWCIRGFTTAKGYLDYGNIYIYYTNDDTKNTPMPRIVIRMKGNTISEIRGVLDDNQNIEIEFIEILENKLKEFDYQEDMYYKLNNLKKIKELFNKKKYEIEFNKEDLEFIYNYDADKDGFGYNEDNRINILKEGRNIKQDLAKIYNCKEAQVALSIDDLKRNDIVVYQGDLNLGTLHELNDIVIPKYVLGNVDLSLLTSSKNLEKLTYVKGDLKLFNLLETSSLSNLERVNGNLYLSNLLSSYGLQNLKIVDRGAYFTKLKDASYLKELTYIGEIGNFSELEDSTGLEHLEEIGWNAIFNSLKNTKGLTSLRKIGWHGNFFELEDTEGLEKLEVIIKDANFPKIDSPNKINKSIKIGGKQNFKQKQLQKKY